MEIEKSTHNKSNTHIFNSFHWNHRTMVLIIVVIILRDITQYWELHCFGKVFFFNKRFLCVFLCISLRVCVRVCVWGSEGYVSGVWCTVWVPWSVKALTAAAVTDWTDFIFTVTWSNSSNCNTLRSQTWHGEIYFIFLIMALKNIYT